MPSRSFFCFLILFQIEYIDLVRPLISNTNPAASNFFLTGSINDLIYASRSTLVSFNLRAISVNFSLFVYLSDKSSSSDFIAYNPNRCANGAYR